MSPDFFSNVFSECCDPVVGLSPPDSFGGEMVLGIDLGGAGVCPIPPPSVSLLVNIVCVAQRIGTVTLLCPLLRLLRY